MWGRFFSVLAAILLLASAAQAQVFNFSHTRLPQAKPARVVFQDRQGYLWIGSEGLLRYDGADFVSYEHDARNPASLTSDDIKSITQDGKGNIWVGTSQGISRLDPVDGRITNFLPGTKGKCGLGAAYNWVCADDAGTVWTGNYAGLARYDPALQCFVPYPLAVPGDGRHGNRIVQIRPDPKRRGWLWLMRRQSLLHLDTRTGRVERYVAPGEVFLTSLLADRAGKVWVCSWGDGLGQLDLGTGQFLFQRFEADGNLGTDNVAVDIAEQRDRLGQITYYVATAGGLTTLSLDEAGRWDGSYARPFQAYDPADSRTPGTGIAQLLVDRQNILWLATSQNLSHLAPNNRVFGTTVLKGLGNVYALEKRSGGGWWLGSWYGRGIVTADEALRETEPTPYLPGMLPPDCRQVSALLEEPGGRILWAATFGGLFSIDLATGKRTAWPADAKAATGLMSDHTITLAWLPGRRLWIGTYSRGAALLDVATGKYLPVPKELAGRRINLIYVDKAGRTWMAADHDILRIDADGRYRCYSYKAGQARCKAENDVTSFAEDSIGGLWIGSLAGLNRYCPATDDFDLITMTDGLSSNKIQSLLTDRRGRLWVGTENGLCALGRDGRIQRYFVQNGLYANNVFNSVALASDGHILIGGEGFMTRFDPDRLQENRQPPPVSLSGLRLINQPAKKLYPQRIGANELRLRHDENYLALDFIALNLINPDQNRYAYRLEGLDNAWIQAGLERRAIYSNLAPGSYRFRVRAANGDGHWNSAGASLAFTVMPPYWQTWWFQLLVALAVAAALYGIYRYRLNQVLALERIRTDISAGLHDEIGSTLSSISILSGMVPEAPKPEYVATTMGAINQSSRGLMEQMNDIVWSINPRYDSLQSLLQRLGQFAAHVLEAQDIDFIQELPAHLPTGHMAVQVRQNLYLILKEAVNNMAKHSGATEVRLRVGLTGSHLVIGLSDNGRGYDPETVGGGGNGLHNIAQRAEAIKAELRQTATPGRGTHLHLRLRWNKYAIAGPRPPADI